MLVRRAWILLMPALVAAACSGRMEDGKPASRPAGPGDIPYVPTPVATEFPTTAQTAPRLRRLTNRELENVVTDLLGTRLDVTKGFTLDPQVEGYENDAAALSIGDSKLEEIASIGERVAAFVTAAENLPRLRSCAADQNAEACTGSFVTGFAARAWGRPLSDDERTRLLEVARVGRSGGDEANAVALALEAIIQSPHFLYRTELGEDDGKGGWRLTNHEIASQLSFLLNGGRPDPELLAAAAAGELHDPAARERHARRLMGTSRGRQQIHQFIRSWLGLGHVAMLNKDVGAFGFFTPTLRQAMDRELETFIEHVLTLPENQLDELMYADYTFPSPALIPVYGNDLLSAPGNFTRVSLRPRRRGILSSPAFLASHAQIASTSPVERGLMVRERMLCMDIPPPPPNVLAVPPAGKPGQTTRQKYEAHSSDKNCVPCHQYIDPIGFGFEKFDAVARYRETEAGQPIDDSGHLEGTDVDGPFAGPAALAYRLVRSHMFRRCFVAQFWRFAEARNAAEDDEREIDALAYSFELSKHQMDELVVALVRKPTFIARRKPTEESR